MEKEGRRLKNETTERRRRDRDRLHAKIMLECKTLYCSHLNHLYCWCDLIFVGMRWTLFALRRCDWMVCFSWADSKIFRLKITIFWFKAGLNLLSLSWIDLSPLFALHFWHLHLSDNKLFVSLALWPSFVLQTKQMHHVRKKRAASLLPWFQYFQLLLLSEWWASQRAQERCARGSWSLHIHTWQTVRGTNRKQQSTEELMRRCKTRYISEFISYRQIIIQLSTNIKVIFFGTDFPCLKK